MDTASAERELGRLIERRHDPRDGEAMRDPGYAASEARYHERLREENRAAWSGWHLEQAERLERTAAELASAHRRRAGELLGGEPPGGGGR